MNLTNLVDSTDDCLLCGFTPPYNGHRYGNALGLPQTDGVPQSAGKYRILGVGGNTHLALHNIFKLIKKNKLNKTSDIFLIST